jgi:hypothetical protein
MTLASIKRSEQWQHVGGLSQPSKMPCYGYSIPAEQCNVGSKLRTVQNSTCSDCYAFKGHYPMANVQRSMWRRFEALTVCLDSWTDSMAWILAGLRDRGETHFRWHDSGDLQSVEHLRAIAWIARAVPEISFWLPTRETLFVHAFVFARKQAIPDNLNVRLSVPMVGSLPSGLIAILAQQDGITVSGVNVESMAQCPAYTQGGKCLDCRSCWDRSVPAISYPLH